MAQSTAGGTSSRRHTREHDVSSSSTATRYMDSEWETKEALRQRELEEARARAAQMEKTMRWWSDCTANWREKWSKVRNERNKAREEAKVLKTKLEIATKDANTFKHDSQELELQNEQLKREMEKIHTILLKHAGQFDRQIITILESDPRLRDALGVDELLEVYNNAEHNEKSVLPSAHQESVPPHTLYDGGNLKVESRDTGHDRDIEEYVLQGAVPKHAVELYKEGSLGSLDTDIAKLVVDTVTMQDSVDVRQSSVDIANEDVLVQKMSVLRLKLDEATETISTQKDMEKLKVEVIELRERCDQLQQSKAETTKELLELKDRFQKELNAAQADLMDETSNREGMDRRLSDLRTELEKLQAENAAEWGKRERLETEKISLERENKQLRNELRDLQERVETRRVRPVSTTDTESALVQQELLERNKELLELKHVHAKLKKILAEKTTELSHASRRSEQYESEVRRLRARVEELKKELASAQDEVDVATSNVRKLQRANEDLLEQLQSANVRLEHFRNRIQRTTCATDSSRSSYHSENNDLNGKEYNNGSGNDDDDNDYNVGNENENDNDASSTSADDNTEELDEDYDYTAVADRKIKKRKQRVETAQQPNSSVDSTNAEISCGISEKFVIEDL
ncbi:coiled-coil domain-containing protein 102A isoform X2 [Cephus cinctus]|uniref:Coiled-coil domain-containing protein 102A isoform X2 n=1 Tax=Cephus cinctus TaxID=211228 RepID=A0AAJ7CCK7_CEPCN|nr:coiled-coil domain-containing protein 102A isoform X2 [Cephus cinctus]